MTTLPESSPLIATRVLHAGGRAVIVRNRAPRPARRETDWSCSYRNDGLLDEPYEGVAHGNDAVQALLLALVEIGDYLVQQTPSLHFSGYTELGFPVTERLPYPLGTGHLVATIKEPLSPSASRTAPLDATTDQTGVE